MFDDDFKRILKDRARSCDLGGLDTLLAKYGQHDDCLALIKKGVYEHLAREDSGDWTSPASSGWKSASDKKKRLEEFILERGPSGMFNAVATPAAIHNDDTIARLQKQVHQLESRLRQLEQREDARKFKFNT